MSVKKNSLYTVLETGKEWMEELMGKHLKEAVMLFVMAALLADCGDNGDAELTGQLKVSNCGFARYKGQC